MQDPKFLDKIKMFGLLKYNLKKILSILRGQIDPTEFIRQFNDQESDIYLTYRSGFDNADFAIEKPIFDSALKGDLDAVKLLDERREESEYKQNVNQIFGDDEI